jgi:hypothetical protein
VSPEESKLLRRVAEDVAQLKRRDYTGFGVTAMVFFMFFNFLLDGCSFK